MVRVCESSVESKGGEIELEREDTFRDPISFYSRSHALT